jgi:hypothetical protein
VHFAAKNPKAFEDVIGSVPFSPDCLPQAWQQPLHDLYQAAQRLCPTLRSYSLEDIRILLAHLAEDRDFAAVYVNDPRGPDADTKRSMLVALDAYLKVEFDWHTGIENCSVHMAPDADAIRGMHYPSIAATAVLH